MEIRKAEMQDAEELNKLLTLLIRDERQYDSNISEDFVVTNMYENYIYDNNRCIAVAVENEEIIGYIYGYINKDETLKNNVGFLDALYIIENYRGKGIGNALINYFKSWAIEQKATLLEVNVWSKNIKAKNLYNKHNFVTEKETLLCEIASKGE